ncbi:MAG: hypothetical protein ABR985_08965 [Methanotrichaceae archaeon]|jgi:hypothetical protein
MLKPKDYIILLIFPISICLYFWLSFAKLLENYGLSVIGDFIGFYFAVVVGHYSIAEIVAKMWIAATGRKDDPASPLDTSAIIGWVERSFYIVFLLLGKPEVIGFWLTLKTAGRIWGEERPSKETPTRTIYQIFLIGNALSIGYAVGRMENNSMAAEDPCICSSFNYLFKRKHLDSSPYNQRMGSKTLA